MATTQKQVQVLARYAHKTDGKLNGIVTYCVKSSNGKDTYCTTLINGKASGCSCPSHKPCYHMKGLEAKEQERASEMVVETPVLVESSAEVEQFDGSRPMTADEWREVMKRDRARQKTEKAADMAKILEARAQSTRGYKSADVSTKGNLNTGRAFSLLR
jgi:hypothetical protein